MSFAVPADQPPESLISFVLDSCTARKSALTSGWWMWVIRIREQITERRFMQVDKKQDCRSSVWFAIYEEILFAFVTDLSVLTFILLIKKKFTLISFVSGHDKYISCPKSYYAKFISHSSMGQKIYLRFVLFNSFECIVMWFYAFPNFWHFTCTFFFIFSEKKREREKADLKLNV